MKRIRQLLSSGLLAIVIGTGQACMSVTPHDPTQAEIDRREHLMRENSLNEGGYQETVTFPYFMISK